MNRIKFIYKLLMVLFLGVLLTSLWSNNIYLLVLFSLSTYLILPFKKYWDGTALALLFFSVFYSIMALMTKQSGSGFMLISFLIAPVAFYRFGNWIMSHFYTENIRQKLFLLIIICYLLSLFIMTFQDIALVGIVNDSRVLLEDINDGDSLAATLYGLMASVGIGCIAALFTKGQSVLLKLCYIILSILSILVVVHLVNRTGLVVSFTCVLVSFVISTRLKITKIIPALILCGVTVFIIVKTGIVNNEIIDAYQQRELSSTSGTIQLGGRSAIWSDALSKFVTHPFGWNRVHYAHNLWLDIARVGGWLTLLFFLIATINWCKRCFHLIRKKTTPFVLTLISINVAMFLSSCVEPVIEGSMLFFSLFMMIWGCTTAVSQEKFSTVQ